MSAAARVGARIARFPVTRIVLATLPIALVTSALQAALNALHLRHRAPGALLSLVASAAMLASYAGYVRLVERRAPSELGGGWASGGAEAGRGFLLGVALFGVTIAILWALGAVAIARGDGWGAAGLGLVAALGAGVGEEILLRAIFFRIVEEALGSWIALLLSAALFGALHAFNPGATLVSSAAIALEAGVLLAAAFLVTRRLWLPIGLHTGWNFTEGSLFGASVSGTTAHGVLRTTARGPGLLSGGAFGPEASLLAVILCLAVGAALLARAHRRGRFVSPFWRRPAATPAPLAASA